MLYAIVKTLHILSATILFGTGIGIAFFFSMGMRSRDPIAAWFAARTTAVADMIFTLTAGLAQPVTGLWLIHLTGQDPAQGWLLATYALYALALCCWLPVVWLQISIRDMWRARLDGALVDDALLRHRIRLWYLLGWPAFGGLIVIFWLMVAKPAL